MKQIHLLITIFVFGLASYLQAYEVIDGSKNGYEVKAEDYVTVTTPDQQMIRVTSFPFVTPNSNIAPVAPIICTWDPTGQWLGIFIPLRQITEIHLFSLKSNQLLKVEPFDRTAVFPSWWSKPMSGTRTTPVAWEGRQLSVNTIATLKNGTEGGELKTLLERVFITGDTTFKIAPMPIAGAKQLAINSHQKTTEQFQAEDREIVKLYGDEFKKERFHKDIQAMKKTVAKVNARNPESFISHYWQMNIAFLEKNVPEHKKQYNLIINKYKIPDQSGLNALYQHELQMMSVKK
jgi:hypothetical protein